MEAAPLIWGGYAWGNTGDELLLAIAQRDVARVHGCEARVLRPVTEPPHPVTDHTQFIDVPNRIPRHLTGARLWRWADRAAAVGSPGLARCLYRLASSPCRRGHPASPWVAAVRRASALHLTGGGYLTDLFNLDFFLRPVRLAQAWKVPVSASPLGIGPFSTPVAELAVARALAGTALLVRDEVSLEFCRRHNLPAREVRDDGFRLSELVPVATASAHNANTTPCIGVCLFGQYESSPRPLVAQWWRACLQAVIKQLPYVRIEGFCFHTDVRMDYQTTRQLFMDVGLDPGNVQPPQPDFRRAIQHLRAYSAILTTRFHAAVCALCQGIPSVTVYQSQYYEAKMGSALRHATAPRLAIDARRDSAGEAARFLIKYLPPE